MLVAQMGIAKWLLRRTTWIRNAMALGRYSWKGDLLVVSRQGDDAFKISTVETHPT